MTRPKLGFELGPGEKKGQIGEARPVGEGREFSELGNIGRGALRALDNLRDVNRFRGFFRRRNTASLRANDAGFFIFLFPYVRQMLSLCSHTLARL